MEIYKQLAAFQQECPIIHKGTSSYGYSYADLPTIFNVINPLLAKHNLGFTQLVGENQIKTIVFTTNTKDPQMIESMTTIPTGVTLKGMNEYQVLGSAITYIRRYALSSILGLVTDKDTDASGKQESAPKQVKTDDKPWLNKNTPQFKNALEAMKSGKADIEKIGKHYKMSKEVRELLISKSK